MSQKLREQRLKVTCENSKCGHHLQTRYLRIPYLGNDVFFTPSLLCVCGWILRTQMEQTTT